jgi:hypothetical protein
MRVGRTVRVCDVFAYLLGCERRHQILLVGKHEQRHTGQLLLGHQIRELDQRLLDALAVGAVNHPDECVRVVVVVAPVWGRGARG